MSRSQESFGKKEKEKKRLKKRQDKLAKAAERKASSPGGGLDSMMAYVDEFGNISDTPPDLTKKKEEIDAESIQLGVPVREAEEPAGEPTGRVEYFDHSKGFGFIKDEMGGDKYFVHVSACIDEITEGDKVTYNLEKGPRGMNAVSVKKI